MNFINMLKNVEIAVCNKVKSVALAVAGGVTAVVAGVISTAQEAQAALPTTVGTTITGIQTDGQAVFDLVFPVIGVFLGLAIIIKLFKRFSNKL